MLGAPPVLLVNHALRPLLSRFLRRSLPQLVVLSNMELSDNRHIRMTATIEVNNARWLWMLCLPVWRRRR
jgi:flagellar biosynthesis protein FlhA